MKLIFSGIVVAAKLVAAMRGNGFDLVTDIEDADLIAQSLKDDKGLKAFEALRAARPRAYLIAVIPAAALNDTGFHERILGTAPDDVWLLENWEITIWFALQRAARVQRIEAALETRARAEAELRASSEELVAQLERQIQAVGEIQRSLLPPFAPEIPGVSVTVKYLPASGPGGDYYDLFELGDRKRFGVLLADSRTHGAVAGILSALLKIRPEEMNSRFGAPADFIDHLLTQISDSGEKVDQLLLLYGVFDRAALTFEFTAQGNLDPVLWRDDAITTLDGSIGPRTRRWNLKPGDRLILRTDGVEAVLAKENGPGQTLATLLARLHAEPLDLQNEILGFIKRQGGPRTLPDDLTLLQFVVHPRALYVAAN